VSLPLVGPGKYADLGGALGTTAHPIFRSDLDAPIMELQTESDITGVLNSVVVRQPDGDKFRLWEVAGTAHADAHLLGSFASGVNCGVPINNGPMHIVAKASFNAFETWVRAGTLPVVAPRLQTTPAPVALVRDADGIVLGGIRTPPVDVPVDVLSGVATAPPSAICLLLGSTIPLPDTRIAQLYTSAADYTQKFGASADQAIAAGFVLAPDRDALIAYSQPTRVP
jgi:hypothetical protein